MTSTNRRPSRERSCALPAADFSLESTTGRCTRGSRHRTVQALNLLALQPRQTKLRCENLSPHGTATPSKSSLHVFTSPFVAALMSAVVPFGGSRMLGLPPQRSISSTISTKPPPAASSRGVEPALHRKLGRHRQWPPQREQPGQPSQWQHSSPYRPLSTNRSSDGTAPPSASETVRRR